MIVLSIGVSLVIFVVLWFIWYNTSVIKYYSGRSDAVMLKSDLFILTVLLGFVILSAYIEYDTVMGLVIVGFIWVLVELLYHTVKTRGVTQQRLRFAGLSTGGIIPGTRIWNRRHKLTVYRDDDGYFKSNVARKWLPSMMHPVFLIYPLMDIIVYAAVYRYDDLVHFYRANVRIDTPTLPSWLSIPAIPHADAVYPIGIAIAIFIVYYFTMLRGVGSWHGCEHKVIAAAENNDLANAKSYSPVHERCGGSVLFTVGIIIAVYMVFDIVFAGMYSFILLVIIFEGRHWHKHNRIGIWIGKIIQSRFTIAEPQDWQLDVTVDGMKRLLAMSASLKGGSP